jgi:ATP-binding cassette subfamily B protein
VWTVLKAVGGAISIGSMTMYLLLFRQGQQAVSAILSAIGGMYEDNLYLSTLYDYLDTPVPAHGGSARRGPDPADGVRFEHVSFRYPGAEAAALQDVTLHLAPGSSLALVGENGSGKTTLIKLLAGLYPPDSGRITLDGLDVAGYDPQALRARIGVIFQDFARYQLMVGENVGAGDEAHFEDEARWRTAAAKGRAADFIEQLPRGYQTQLGKWFRDGREISGGQWQKVALSRAFMRTHADVLVLDEPTAAMDARAEAEVFEHFRQLAHDRITILISHRFSTVRMADQIAVLDQGRIIEQGSHAELMARGGHYAQLFSLQARGYQ